MSEQREKPDRSRAGGTGQRLYERARRIIPGATQLLGKRAEMYLPGQWPAYYSRAKGCEIWDLDDNKYFDFTMVGIGSSVLGYADPDVEAAVIRAIQAGNMTTLNCPEEVELAELLCELHPWAESVRYARTGGEMMAVGVRIARAATGRDKIAFCGYHGWHDWYLGVNLSEGDALGGHLLPGLEPLGVPKGLAGTLLPFNFNDLDALERVATEHGPEIAAIVMEPVRSDEPKPGFLQGVREIATRVGAVLFFDEITSGFRMLTAGMHRRYGVDPDLASFGKTISNGHPMAALIGRRSVMDYAQRTFISSAYWTERTGPAAALATLHKHRRLDVGKALTETGLRIQAGWQKAADQAGIKIRVFGIPPLATFAFEYPNAQEILTLHIQNMLDRGFLASHQCYTNLMHTEALVERYLEAYAQSLTMIADALSKGEVLSRLRGPVKHSGFARLT